MAGSSAACHTLLPLLHLLYILCFPVFSAYCCSIPGKQRKERKGNEALQPDNRVAAAFRAAAGARRGEQHMEVFLEQHCGGWVGAKHLSLALSQPPHPTSTGPGGLATALSLFCLHLHPWPSGNCSCCCIFPPPEVTTSPSLS